MALFGFGKKKEAVQKKTACCCDVSDAEVKEAVCSCNGNAAEAYVAEGSCCGENVRGITSIKVLGSGCKRCHELKEASNAAIKELGINLEATYITDIETIVSYGVMSMPALVINEKVVSMGKVLKTEDIIKLLKKLKDF